MGLKQELVWLINALVVNMAKLVYHQPYFSIYQVITAPMVVCPLIGAIVMYKIFPEILAVLRERPVRLTGWSESSLQRGNFPNHHSQEEQFSALAGHISVITCLREESIKLEGSSNV